MSPNEGWWGWYLKDSKPCSRWLHFPSNQLSTEILFSHHLLNLISPPTVFFLHYLKLERGASCLLEPEINLGIVHWKVYFTSRNRTSHLLPAGDMMYIWFALVTALERHYLSVYPGLRESPFQGNTATNLVSVIGSELSAIFHWEQTSQLNRIRRTFVISLQLFWGGTKSQNLCRNRNPLMSVRFPLLVWTSGYIGRKWICNNTGYGTNLSLLIFKIKPQDTWRNHL